MTSAGIPNCPPIMKILYVAGREESYSRTRIVIRALEMRGHEVIKCLPPDKSFKHYPGLVLSALLKAPSCDVVLTGFYGQLLTPVIRLLTWKPIVFDMYITTYDTMVFDREKARPGSLKAKLYALSDWLSYKAANVSILDSNHVIAHFGEYARSSTSKLRRLFLAVDNTVIYPRERQQKHEAFLVHFHGEYIPFHGVKHIFQAAKLLENENVAFQIIGRGLTFEQDMALLKELNVQNVKILDPVPYAGLATHMAEADVCLGIFGDNMRAELVLTNKVNEAIGMAKPLITRRNAPVQELLQHKESVYLVDAASPRAIADAILELQRDEGLRQKIAENGHRRFLEHGTIQKLGEGLEAILNEVVSKKA